MKTFRLQLRFVVPLAAILAIAAYVALPLMDRLTLRWFARDLNMRGALVANALSESVADAVLDSKGRKIQALFDRTVQDERLVAIGWCNPQGQLARRTQRFPKDLSCERRTTSPAAPTPNCASRAARCTSACTRCRRKRAASGASCSCTT
jgi:hypothetical protein